ncbi:TB2/DP1, HVA22 family-domain-containing protein [Lactarius psammicola]|nr:TB2/DP1, HVA22 family-domain-containing protein [Lactarius psammicola]
MLVYIVSRLLTAWFVFLLPSYSTFKALKQRPLNEREVEKWASYWTVVGTLVTFEYTAEWLLSWFPFYWEAKTLFLLFLSLPQFEGSTHVYKAYLEPFLVQNEKDIDATIVSARDETVQFIQLRLSALWDIVYSFLSKTPITQHPSPSSSRETPINMSPQKALQSIQGLLGVATPPSFLAPSVHRGRPASEDPSAPTHPSGVAVPAGYDVGEAVNN